VAKIIKQYEMKLLDRNGEAREKWQRLAAIYPTWPTSFSLMKRLCFKTCKYLGKNKNMVMGPNSP
jgi:hypothetical protein